MTTSTSKADMQKDLEDSLSKWTSDKLLPTATDLYRLGRFLHNHLSSHDNLSNVKTAYHDMLEALPETYRAQLFGALKQALLNVLETTTLDASAMQKEDALVSVAALYLSSRSALAATHWSLDEIKVLQSVYNDETSSSLVMVRQTILSILSDWLWTKPNVEWEELLPAMHLLQDEESSSLLTDLIQYKNDQTTPGWKSELLERFSEHSDYLQSFLETNQEEDDVQRELQQALADPDALAVSDAASTPVTTITARNELQRRIGQVRQVLPDLGEGFVEICLAYYQGDVERTVAALVDPNNNSLPPQLRLLDPSLPRRRRRPPDSTSLEDDNDDEEARLVAKEALRAAQRQQEEEAYLVDRVMKEGAHDEYNDDYDDQYDDTEGIGAADVGLYDDYDAVKAYNRAVKQVEQDQQFWEDNRNTNRNTQPSTKKNKSSENGGNPYRGPDKMKGGRVPQAGRGGQQSRGGRGGGRGRRRTNVSSGEDSEAQAPGTTSGGTSNQNSGKKGKTKAKQRQMANRRDRRKKATAKRSGEVGPN